MLPSVPCGNQNRPFQYSWLSQHNGHVYSEEEKGGYCKYCVLCKAPYQCAKFHHPATKKATEKLREHFIGTRGSSAHHLQAVEKTQFHGSDGKQTSAY